MARHVHVKYGKTYAREIWQDICTAVDRSVDFVYTDADSVPEATEPAQGYLEYPMEPEEADTLLEEPALRAKYLTTEKYEQILQQIFGSSGTSVYYELTRYIYDLTAENPEVLAEYGNSTVLRTAYTYAGDTTRVSGGTASSNIYYLYDGRGSVSETVKNGKVSNTLRYDLRRVNAERTCTRQAVCLQRRGIHAANAASTFTRAALCPMQTSLLPQICTQII